MLGKMADSRPGLGNMENDSGVFRKLGSSQTNYSNRNMPKGTVAHRSGSQCPKLQ